MAEPFITLDGEDRSGIRAEVYVQTGNGTVAELTEHTRNGKTNVHVRFKVEHLRHPVQGWTTADSAFYPALVEAKENGREVAYRIESQRKKTVDRTIPMAELRKTMDAGRENTLLVLAAVDGVLSDEAVTNPAEDPAPGGRVRATDNPAPAAPPAADASAAGAGLNAEQALAGLANARRGGFPDSVIDAAAALALAAGATVQQVQNAGVQSQDSQGPREVQRVHAKEAAPYTRHNSDGRLNLGSYEVSGIARAEQVAMDLLTASAVRIAEEHNDALARGEKTGEPMPPQKIEPKNAAAMGAVLLGLADRVQVGMYGGGRPDRMAKSHTTARAYVFAAVKGDYPIPFGPDVEAREAWANALVDYCVNRFTTALRYAEQAQAPAQESAPQRQQATPAAQAGGNQGGQVRQMPNTGQGDQSAHRTPVEGDEDFEAPTEDVLDRFRTLTLAAGFEPVPGSPVAQFLQQRYGVASIRKVHGATVSGLVGWYEAKGENGPANFRDFVLGAIGQQVSPATGQATGQNSGQASAPVDAADEAEETDQPQGQEAGQASA